MTSRKPKILYHYCSIETFANIFKNSSIWLSDIQQSNDSLELNYFKSFYSTLVNIATSEFIRNQKEKEKNYDPFELSIILELFTTPTLLEATKTWGFCLSEKQDLLSQWRGYADDGMGVAIGFNKNYLSEVVASILGELLNSSQKAFGIIELKKINYSDTTALKAVQNLFDPIECGKSETLEEFKKNLQAPLFNIDIISPYYKHNSFREECEWRIVLSSPFMNNLAYNTINVESETSALGQFAYVASNKKLISHFELKLKNLHNAVDCIILGPKCKVTATEMKLFLFSLGILDGINDNSIKILQSSSSYR